MKTEEFDDEDGDGIAFKNTRQAGTDRISHNDLENMKGGETGDEYADHDDMHTVQIAGKPYLLRIHPKYL